MKQMKPSKRTQHSKTRPVAHVENRTINRPIKGIVKWMPVAFVLLAMSVSAKLIVNNERQMQVSQPVYLSLRPVDPRSILQGDYMRLRYELFFTNADESITTSIDSNANNTTNFESEANTEANVDSLDDFISGKHRLLAFVELDNKRKVVSTRLQGADARHTQPLVLKNPKNRLRDVYVAANSFLFAEGLASCYDEAEFAKVLVDAEGNTILQSLVGQDLQELNCESQGNWFKRNIDK